MWLLPTVAIVVAAAIVVPLVVFSGGNGNKSNTAAPAPAQVSSTAAPNTATTTSGVTKTGQTFASINVCQYITASDIEQAFGFTGLTATPQQVQTKSDTTIIGCEYDESGGNQDAIVTSQYFPAHWAPADINSAATAGLVGVQPVSGVTNATAYSGSSSDGTATVLVANAKFASGSGYVSSAVEVASQAHPAQRAMIDILNKFLS